MENDTKRGKHHHRCSTAEILGLASGPRIPARWVGYHQKLLELRERLAGDRDHHSAEAKDEHPNFSQHIADAGTDSYDRDWSLALASSSQSMLFEVEEAIHRIEHGTYGTCQISGEAIESERLRAIPWTRYSARAQASLEERGDTRRVRIGSLGNWDSSGSNPETEVQDEAA